MTPNICFVEIQSNSKMYKSTICGAIAVGWIARENVERLELLGWTFPEEMQCREIPVCSAHFGFSAGSLNPPELV